MPKRNLPSARLGLNRAGSGFELPASALDRWNPAIRAAGDEGGNTISIFGVIGEDFWSDSNNNSKRIAAALRSIGERDVVVNINSPGGDFFEGLSIYNLLREHKGEVTVKVMGLAASAASIIAMAGDTVMVPRAGFLMIHNVWVLAIGNRHDLREASDMLEPFDTALADIYAAHTGLERDEIAKMLDREAWIGGSEAVDKGFADQLLPSDEIAEKSDPEGASALAAHRIDNILAKAGVPRSERRRLIRDSKGGTPSAAPDGMPGAAESAADEAACTGLSDLLAKLRGITIA